MTTIDLKKLDKLTVVAPLKTEMAAVAAALSLPPVEERQPDLQYMAAILVSSGMNKNGAVFLGSELCKARKSIAYKAVDIEHEERMIIGQIMDAAYMDRTGQPMDPEEMLKNVPESMLDMMDMDVGVSCIVHKARFPEIAEEILRGEWMVSMECFYRDYDVKVGDLIIPREQATALGYDKLIGQVVRVKDGKSELGYHLVGRVLRDIHFCGVGIVKNPANERSVIFDAASLKQFVDTHKENASVINLADITTIETATSEKTGELSDIAEVVRSVVREELEHAGLRFNDMRPGTCVHYKKEVVSLPSPQVTEPATDLTQDPLFSPPGGVDSNPPGATITKEHHCALFDIECSSRPGDATSPECWRNVFGSTVKDVLGNFEDVLMSKRYSDDAFVRLEAIIAEAKKFRK